MDRAGEVRALELKREQLRAELACNERTAGEIRQRLCAEHVRLEGKKLCFEEVCARIRGERKILRKPEPERLSSVDRKIKKARVQKREIAELERRVASLNISRTSNAETALKLKKRQAAIEQAIAWLEKRCAVTREGRALEIEVESRLRVSRSLSECSTVDQDVERGELSEIGAVFDGAGGPQEGESPMVHLIDSKRNEMSSSFQWDGHGSESQHADSALTCEQETRERAECWGKEDQGGAPEKQLWERNEDPESGLEGRVTAASADNSGEASTVEVSYTTAAGQMLTLAVRRSCHGKLNVSVRGDEEKAVSSLSNVQIRQALVDAGLEVETIAIM